MIIDICFIEVEDLMFVVGGLCEICYYIYYYFEFVYEEYDMVVFVVDKFE